MFYKLLLIVLMLVLPACKNSDRNQAEGLDERSSLLTEKRITAVHTHAFAVRYQNNIKLVDVFAPPEYETIIYKYALLPHGKSIPPGYDDYKVIRVPVKSILAMSSLYIGYLEKLNALETVIGIDDKKYITSSTLHKMIDEGKVSEVGELANMNFEKVIELDPGLFLTYGYGSPSSDGYDKLIDLGINVVSTTTHLENTPLARAEWIKFISLFINKEKEANQYFDLVEKRYYELSALTKNIKRKPTVFNEAKYGDVWYLPGGKSFAAQIIKDAGGKYLWEEDEHTGSIKLKVEEVYSKAHEADVWINVHRWAKLEDALDNDPRNEFFRAYKTGNIYNYNSKLNGIGGNAYWEEGPVSPHLILADLIKIFHPGLMPDYEFYFYKKLD